jgi:DNA-binding transcriptional ArsR family regulator
MAADSRRGGAPARANASAKTEAFGRSAGARMGYHPRMAMVTGVNLAEVGSLVGDVTRAHMLNALSDGRALTAGELAWRARVTPQTASDHLGKMTEAGLLTVIRQGRNRYFQITSADVAHMVESMLAVAAVHGAPRHRPTSKMDDAMALARSCYDHLAGRLGVALTDALVGRGHIVLTPDGGAVTDSGSRFAAGFGLDLKGAQSSRRSFCRPCLDWSERRFHLAGVFGTALLHRLIDLDWVARTKDSRALRITDGGRRGLSSAFDIAL